MNFKKTPYIINATLLIALIGWNRWLSHNLTTLQAIHENQSPQISELSATVRSLELALTETQVILKNLSVKQSPRPEQKNINKELFRHIERLDARINRLQYRHGFKIPLMTD